MTEDEMVGWDHGLNGHGFGWTPGVDDRQGGRRAAVHEIALTMDLGKKCIIMVAILKIEEAMHVWEPGVYGKSLCITLNFIGNKSTFKN